jgi:hypothetical protein
MIPLENGKLLYKQKGASEKQKPLFLFAML